MLANRKVLSIESGAIRVRKAEFDFQVSEDATSDPQVVTFDLRTADGPELTSFETTRSIQEIVGTGQRNLADWSRDIYDAETQPVPTELRSQFLRQWRGFIEQYRGSNDAQVASLVRTAIRKYVGELPAAELVDIAFLLNDPHETALPIEWELTIAKMIVRKLTANPQTAPQQLDGIAANLWRMVDDYARDSMVARKYFGAAALDAALALLIIGGDYSQRVIERLKSLESSWFVEAVSDEIREVAEEIARMRPEAGDQINALMRSVRAMTE